MGMLGMHVGVDTGPGKTKQAMANEVDINKIVAGYEKTGMIEHLNTKAPFYGDVSEVVDYQGALEVVRKAEELFMGMDAKIRERFQNDPVQMIEFLQNPSNLEEAVKLGMAVKRPEIGLEAPIQAQLEETPNLLVEPNVEGPGSVTKLKKPKV